VLSATGPATALLRQLSTETGTVNIAARLGAQRAIPRTVVGGWPRLLVDGRNVGAIADSLEGTMPRFSSARHPRSAIGVSRDSSVLMLVVVDGRRPWSAGMSLTELADQMLALGAYQAMNLDGGGSSTLWVHGTIVNYPSDAAGERTVGNALMVLKRRTP
jgi:exopolysaccharide biosynthesis protein